MSMNPESKPTSELSIKKLQLHWLLQITKAINYNLPAPQLYAIYETVMRDQLKIEKLVLYIHEDRWARMLAYGVDNSFDLKDVESRLGELNQLQLNNVHMPDWVEGFESIIPVFHDEKALAYAFIGDTTNEEVEHLKEILPFIHTITNIIVVAIENKRLTRDTIRQAQMQRELELAARMQSMLFPVQAPHNHRADLAASYLPHTQVGGDYYDYIRLNDQELLLCLADVSGKGISAALLMSNFQANLNAKAPYFKKLEKLVAELNECVNRAARGEKFITAFIGILNTDTFNLRYINAGQNPPFILNQGKCELLEKGTTGLGMFPDLPFIQTGEAELPPGAILFSYTDGVVEQEDAQGIPFGLERLIELVAELEKDRSVHELNLAVLNSFQEYKADTDALDDVTLLSCRMLGR
ncbi:MAG: PP2C family protein-serine/threonine phosphatase [Sphingobacteriales bacterium]|jgi:sigma-B regulation protein RsbU (phosphoserine phosphatase)|nr:PP2C family protein-serine/threonine phosphatase [Sphingobacteriales bacterium]